MGAVGMWAARAGGSGICKAAVRLVALGAVALTCKAEATPPQTTTTSALPPGFLEMYVAGVVPSGDGQTLVLANSEEQLLLPLGIGFNEALSIHSRLERKHFSQPMMHDLIDHIVSELGGKVVQVQITDVRDGVFVGSVTIRTAGKTLSFEARPSDAVALAIGSRAPIYVARPVVDKAGVHPGDLEDHEEDTAAKLPRGVLAL